MVIWLLYVWAWVGSGLVGLRLLRWVWCLWVLFCCFGFCMIDWLLIVWVWVCCSLFCLLWLFGLGVVLFQFINSVVRLCIVCAQACLVCCGWLILLFGG